MLGSQICSIDGSEVRFLYCVLVVGIQGRIGEWVESWLLLLLIVRAPIWVLDFGWTYFTVRFRVTSEGEVWGELE